MTFKTSVNRDIRCGGLVFGIVNAVFLMAGGPAVSDSTVLETIRKKIEMDGMHWTACETSVSALSESERRARVMSPALSTLDDGTLPPVFNGWKTIDVHPNAPVVNVLAEQFSWADVTGDDWTTPVRDQGQCGSCAVFAATAVTEARANISAGDPDLDLDLAEQSLLSCTTGSSCETGTWDTNLFVPTLRDIGIPDEWCHPYTATNGNCADACAGAGDRKFYIVDGGWVPSAGWLTVASDDDIKAGLISGPVYTNMMVPEDFFYYNSGVYEGSIAITSWHTVAIVGWDNHSSDSSPASWIVKNSWGTGWGINGFFEIKRGDATGIGAQATVLEVDASIIENILCAIEAPDLVQVDDGSGDVVQGDLSLELCFGDGPMSFVVEPVDGLASWLAVAPTAGQVSSGNVTTLSLSYSEADFPGTGTHHQDLVVVGEDGHARMVSIGFEISAGDADSDTDVDTDSDTDTDGEPDSGSEDGSGDDSCGCVNAGSSSRVTGLLFAFAGLL